MRKCIIAAVSNNNVIGYKGDMPWGRDCPSDLKRFRTLTICHPIIMGANTHLSIGRPLPKRTNIVVTSRPEIVAAGCHSVRSVKEALAMVSRSQDDNLTNSCGESAVFFIGGARIYEEALKIADSMFLTCVLADFEGDTFFPQFDKDDWDVVFEGAPVTGDADKYGLRFLNLERKSRKIALAA